MSDRVKGKRIFVAGGATGIGEAACRLFCEEGADQLLITDINDTAGTVLAEELNSRSETEVTYRHLDVTREAEWISAVSEHPSGFDILANCFGVGGPLVRPKVADTDNDAWHTVMDINATGLFLGMKHVIPFMQSSGHGSIVNVVSIYGLIGPEFATSYAASKGAARSLTRTAAVQYAKDNIRINGVYPGFTNTPMTKDIHNDPAIRAVRLGQTPMERFAEPVEIAQGILFLACDEASFITGAELVIDGGVTVL